MHKAYVGMKAQPLTFNDCMLKYDIHIVFLGSQGVCPFSWIIVLYGKDYTIGQNHTSSHYLCYEYVHK